jgi:hypothetical protein
MMKIRSKQTTILLALMAMAIMASAPLFSQPSAADRLMSSFFAEKSAKTPLNYYGLNFTIDDATTTCQTGADGKLACKTSAGAEIFFEKIAGVKSQAALRLLQNNRKNSWQKRYPSVNQYVLDSITILGQALTLQRAIYFRFDNINWPVLLRSFDVVMNEGTIINVSTACDVGHWQANIEIIENIERSFKKST